MSTRDRQLRAVIALGGNALLPRGGRLDFDVQRQSAAVAAASLAAVVGPHRVVLTHGNGPQVGLLALQSEAYREVKEYPLDVLVAESEGMIGYILEMELDRVVDVPTITVLTRTLVRADDPAFDEPTKPIGPLYGDTGSLRRFASEKGWTLKLDGPGFRRVVPSPDPVRIMNSDVIRMLVEAGVLVICAGGGGIPVVDEGEVLRGVEAVVDKDLASALLAEELGADIFVCLTDVEGVYERWGEKDQALVRSRSPEWFRARRYPPGSMGPKVEACCRFVEATGHRAAIGRLDRVADIFAGTAGTSFEPDSSRPSIL